MIDVLKCIVPVVVIATITLFVGVGVVHEMIPHDHNGSTAVWDTAHTAVAHHSEKDIAALAGVLLIWSIIPLVSYESARRVIARHADTRQLRFRRALSRGILPFRRFG